MSFVLEALRRAQSSRPASVAGEADLGPLTAEVPATAGASSEEAGPDNRAAPQAMPLPSGHWGLLLVALLALLVALVLALRAGGGQPGAAGAGHTPSTAAASPRLLVAPAAASVPDPAPAAVARPAAAVPQVGSRPVSLIAAPGAAPLAQERIAPGPANAAPAPSMAPAVVAGAPPTLAASAEPVMALERLPPELRGQFPPLAIGGAIWSEDAAGRFVLVSGQVIREGESALPGVVVQRIGPRSLVLRWRGQLVEVALP